MPDLAFSDSHAELVVSILSLNPSCEVLSFTEGRKSQVSRVMSLDKGNVEVGLTIWGQVVR